MKKLSQQDYIEAARILDCEVSDIMAVAEVESRGDGFQPNGIPKILFERHIFRRYTNGKYNASHPHLSGPQGGYKGGAAEWQRFQDAARLDKRAAMLSISMGKFQIMGFNFSLAGYHSVEQFHNAMFLGEGEQLKAFCRFIKNRKLDDELRDNRWAAFAAGYNGSAYKQNQYDTKMASADAKYERQGVDDHESGDILEIDWHLPNTPQTDYAADASVAVPPSPPVSSPANAATEKATPTGGQDVQLVEKINTRIEGAGDAVTSTISTLTSVVGKSRDSVKAFRTLASMSGFGVMLASFGAWFKDNPIFAALIFVGIVIIALFAWKYMTRQEKIAVERTKKQ